MRESSASSNPNILDMQLEIDAQRCVGCGKCADLCRFRVITVKDGTATVQKAADCIKCGHCFSICPENAVHYNGIKQIQTSQQGAEHVIQMRRSVRKYQQAELSKEEICSLINSLKFCPSACNYRPLKFKVFNLLKNPQYDKYIADNDELLLGKKYRPVNGETHFRTAPHMIVCYATQQSQQNSYPPHEDSQIAMGALELIACARGLGSFYCGQLVKALQNLDAKAFFHFKPEDCVLGAVAVGRSDLEYFRPVVREDIALVIE